MHVSLDTICSRGGIRGRTRGGGITGRIRGGTRGRNKRGEIRGLMLCWEGVSNINALRDVLIMKWIKCS